MLSYRRFHTLVKSLTPSAGTVARYQGSIKRLEVMLEMQAGKFTIKLKLSRWSRKQKRKN